MGGKESFATVPVNGGNAPRAADQPAWTEGVKPTLSRH